MTRIEKAFLLVAAIIAIALILGPLPAEPATLTARVDSEGVDVTYTGPIRAPIIDLYIRGPQDPSEVYLFSLVGPTARFELYDWGSDYIVAVGYTALLIRYGRPPTEIVIAPVEPTTWGGIKELYQ